MAEHSSFFDSINKDRLYKAEDYAKYFSSFISNGIFPTPSTNLQVMANGDMTVTVKAGLAWINGYFYYLDADTTFTIDTADGTLNRIDRIAVHLDTVGRAINAKVLKGVIASSPVAPSVQRDADGYELALADIAINAGVTSISQSNITDQRQNQGLCGIVDSLITPDTQTLFNQFTDGFNTWFNTIKGQLGSDAAGNLLNMINDLAGSGRTTETVKGVSDDLASHKADYVRQPAFAPTTGSANTYAITTDPAPAAYVDGMSAYLDINVANTGASTLNWNGLGAKPIVTGKGVALTAGKLPANSIIGVRYNASAGNFQLLGEGGEYGTAGAPQVLPGYTVGTDNGLVNGAYSNIKSIQSGVYAGNSNYVDIPISAVDVTKSIVRISKYASNGVANNTLTTGVLTSSTNLRLEKNTSGGTVEVYWEVIEFNNVKSLQSGTLTNNISTENIISISSINTAKALVFFSYTSAETSSSFYPHTSGGRIISSTSIGIKVSSTSSYTIKWQVIEFN